MPLYSSYTVVLAILEACLAATAALFVFFRYRSHWEDSFVKRGLSSLVLAAAVLGMHHIALAGTTWKFRSGMDLDVAMLHGRKSQSTRLTIGEFFLYPRLEGELELNLFFGCLFQLSPLCAL